MPQVIRKEVREFHNINIYANDPPRVNLDQTRQTKYFDTVFSKENASKISPPLPTFKAMMLNQDIIDMLKNKHWIEEPTSF